MKKIIKLLVISITTLSLSSCALVFKGNNPANIPVNSTPVGAEITINGQSYGTTPTTIQLEDGENYNLIFKLDDETRTYTLKSEVGTLWLVLDILSGGVPLIVDAATGEWLELPEDEVFVSF